MRRWRLTTALVLLALDPRRLDSHSDAIKALAMKEINVAKSRRLILDVDETSELMRFLPRPSGRSRAHHWAHEGRASDGP